MQTGLGLGDVPFPEQTDYVYDSLPPGEYFRSLALEPGSGNDPLRCSIDVSAVADADYEAISYVWGSEVRGHQIYCEGQIVWITANLFQALQRLRHPTDTRRLWADSVCIDQNDLKEKGHQVSIMGQIYSSARRVLLYMGPDPDGHAPKVASLLGDVCDMMQRELDRLDYIDWDCFPDSNGDFCIALLRDERWQSYAALLNQEWFQRGWVVREAGLATEVLVIWGDSHFPWHSLMQTACWIRGRQAVSPWLQSRYPFGSSYELTFHMDIYESHNGQLVRPFIDRRHWGPTRLLDYLGRGRWVKFKDRRDSIYAFLDVHTDTLMPTRLLANYSQSPQEVFQNFAIEYLRTTGDITLLDYIIHTTESLQSGFPSWVPRWEEISQQHDDLFWGYATRSSEESVSFAKPEIIDGKILKAHGLVLDKVSYVSEVLPGKSMTSELFTKHYQSARKFTSQSHLFRELQLRQFVRALTLNTLGRHEVMAAACAHAWIEQASSPPEGGREPPRTQEEAHEQNLLAINITLALQSTAKRFMITDCGHIGMSPAMSRQGDICVRLSGSRVLPASHIYLLRATQLANHYQFVGPAWSLSDMGADCAESDDEWSEGDGLRDIGKDKKVRQQDFYLC